MAYDPFVATVKTTLDAGDVLWGHNSTTGHVLDATVLATAADLAALEATVTTALSGVADQLEAING